MNRWLKLTLVLLPLALSVAIAGLLTLEIWPNYLYTGAIRFDLVGLALRLGLLGTSLGAALWLWQGWLTRRLKQARAAEQTLQEATRRDFLRRLDHELKNPLTIIHLGVSNLQHEAALSDSQTASLTRIAHQTERLQKLIADLRWLTELDEGSLEQNPVDLADVLDEAVLLATDGARYASRQVTLNIQQTPWPLSQVWGDRELLVVAFRNLLENAFKYTDATDRIEVRATENEQMALVEVADSGRGIADHEQELIFDNLYRGQDARHIPGRGLGLALVQQIILVHGGRISVRSRAQTGTVFSIWLPLAG